MEQPANTSFSDMVRDLCLVARRHGLHPPAFSAPPRTPGVDRAIRRMHGGGLMVLVRVRERAAFQVMADLIEGLLVANGIAGREAEGWRLALLAEMGFGVAPARAA